MIWRVEGQQVQGEPLVTDRPGDAERIFSEGRILAQTRVGVLFISPSSDEACHSPKSVTLLERPLGRNHFCNITQHPYNAGQISMLASGERVSQEQIVRIFGPRSN